jgi:hypothetical protein
MTISMPAKFAAEPEFKPIMIKLTELTNKAKSTSKRPNPFEFIDFVALSAQFIDLPAIGLFAAVCFEYRSRRGELNGIYA